MRFTERISESVNWCKLWRNKGQRERKQFFWGGVSVISAHASLPVNYVWASSQVMHCGGSYLPEGRNIRFTVMTKQWRPWWPISLSVVTVLT